MKGKPVCVLLALLAGLALTPAPVGGGGKQPVEKMARYTYDTNYKGSFWLYDAKGYAIYCDDGRGHHHTLKFMGLDKCKGEQGWVYREVDPKDARYDWWFGMKADKAGHYKVCRRRIGAAAFQHYAEAVRCKSHK
jgi:hypothetical protein